MATRSSTKSTTAKGAAVSKAAASQNVEVEIMKEPLQDSDDVEVISIVPHVSYQDNKTNDWYEWEDVGHIEHIDFGTLKNMWRNHKGYFRNMLLKPLDARVVKQFGLESTYKKYEILMDKDSYVRNNMNTLCEAIKSTPNATKYTVCNKIKSMIASGEVSDIAVIKRLEKELNLDLTSSL